MEISVIIPWENTITYRLIYISDRKTTSSLWCNLVTVYIETILMVAFT